jgi:hypothetical protein
MLVSVISKAARRQVRAIVVRQQGLGSLITTTRRVNGSLVVEDTESEQSFIDWLNEADDAKALPFVGWSQRYDTRAQALVLKPIRAAARAYPRHRVAAA